VRAIASAPGLDSAENDDCAGFAETAAGLYAWVIDGATSIAERNYLGAELGDAAWYANALSARLEALAPRGLAPRELHAAAVTEAAALYRQLSQRPEGAAPLYAQPMASLTLVRLAGDAAELFQLGDCPAFAVGKDGAVRRLTVGEPSDEADESHAKVSAAQGRVGFAPKAVWADRLPSLRRARERQLTAAPLGVSTPVGDAAFGGYAARFDPSGLQAIVLMSDGFERFAAKYRLGDDVTMVRRAADEGLARLLAELRAAEEGDPDCRRYPRLKPSDDATCLVIA
jgi:hypothetical protein